jgi:hypothetical protein
MTKYFTILILAAMAYSSNESPAITDSQLKASSPITSITTQCSPPSVTERAWMWAGATERNATQIVRNVEITRRGKKLFVPRSVFADLANPNSVSVMELPLNLTKVVVLGGDASDGYKCVIHIRDGRIVSRKLSDGEFPDNFYEETKYVMIPFVD